MKTIRIILFLLTPLFFYSFSFSQKHDLKLEPFDINSGLSQNNIMCIVQDSRGFMWFGTEDGLNKYDGYNFTIYKNDPKKNTSLGDNYINDIVEDANGDLWIATMDSGLNKYDRQKDQFIHFTHDPKNPNSIADDFVNCLLKDSKENIWIGTSAGL